MLDGLTQTSNLTMNLERRVSSQVVGRQRVAERNGRGSSRKKFPELGRRGRSLGVGRSQAGAGGSLGTRRLTTHHSPLTTHHSPLTTHHSPTNVAAGQRPTPRRTGQRPILRARNANAAGCPAAF